MEEMVKKELGALENIVAKSVSVLLLPRDGVSVEDVTGYRMERVEGNQVVRSTSIPSC